MGVPEADTADGEGRGREKRLRAGQRGIMPPVTDVGAATRARGPEWRRGGEDTCRVMRRARIHAGGPDRWERGKCFGAKVSGEGTWIHEERHGGKRAARAADSLTHVSCLTSHVTRLTSHVSCLTGCHDTITYRARTSRRSHRRCR